MINKIVDKNVLLECGLILLCAVVIGLLFNWQKSPGLAISFHQPLSTAAADTIFFRVQGPTYQAHAPHLHEPAIINKAQLLHLLTRQNVVLLDARSPEDYLAGHIPGAINIPAEQMYEYQDSLNSLSRERWLVCYCDGPPCDLGELLAAQLFTMGYPLVAFYMDGMDDWKKTEKVVTN